MTRHVPSGQIDMDSFRHRYKFGQNPEMPWRRKFYCAHCEETFVGLANVSKTLDGYWHVIDMGTYLSGHHVTEVTNE